MTDFPVPRFLTAADREEILRYCYRQEMEHMFVIGGIEMLPDSFRKNLYVGIELNERLTALVIHFGRFGSLVGSAKNVNDLAPMIDMVVERHRTIQTVPCHRKYAEPIIEQLRKHGMEPTQVSEETFFHLKKDESAAIGDAEVMQAKEEDIDAIIRLEHAVDGRQHAEVLEDERHRVLIDREWIMRDGEKIVARANIHAVSKHFVQLGGVMTHPEYRRKGFGKRVVSTVCKHWIDQGKDIVLFCKNENIPALKIYAQLCFKPVEPFLTAEYKHTI